MKTTPTAPAESTPTNMFDDMIRKHRKGVAATEASKLLLEAITATRDTGAKSEMTLKVTLKTGTDNQMLIDIQVTSKLPKAKLPSGLFWVDDDNKLHTSDPNQRELNLREVERPAPAADGLREAANS